GSSWEGCMIYMFEMDFPHPERLAEWHDWYLAHIRVLLSVPGFRASQRFQAILPAAAPYLHLHEAAGHEMFDSQTYRSRGARCEAARRAQRDLAARRWAPPDPHGMRPRGPERPGAAPRPFPSRLTRP